MVDVAAVWTVNVESEALILYRAASADCDCDRVTRVWERIIYRDAYDGSGL
jgi:hypothetical protein